MKLRLLVEVPTSADQREVEAKLRLAVHRGEGITITTAQGYNVDVHLDAVALGSEVT